MKTCPFAQALAQRIRILLSLLSLLAGVQGTALAWNDYGHMVIAQIAYGRLTPRTKAAVDRLIAVKVEPADVQTRTATFISAACWADDVKRVTNSGAWHYINIPLSLDGVTPQIPPAEMDVVKAIRNSQATLQDGKADDAQKGQSLRYLLHFVGDIHQPLHCTTACSKAHPDGDRGGNSFIINNWNGASNMHFLWDDGVGLLLDRIERPTTASDTQKIDALARTIVAQRPPSIVQGTSPDPQAWAGEGLAVAQATVYTGIQDGGTPDAAYVNKAQPVVRERLARAGYRLADTLNAIFDAKNQSSSNVQSDTFLAYD